MSTLSTCLFDTDKVPESQLPSESTNLYIPLSGGADRGPQPRDQIAHQRYAFGDGRSMIHRPQVHSTISFRHLVCRAGGGLGGDASCPDRRRRSPPVRSVPPAPFARPLPWSGPQEGNPSPMTLPSEPTCRNSRKQFAGSRENKILFNHPESARRPQLANAPFTEDVCPVPVRAHAP